MLYKNSFVTEQGNEIAFIKLCLLLGFPAYKLMQAAVFIGPQHRNYYKTFVTNFLATSDQEGDTNIAKGTIHVVESIQTSVVTKELHEGQINANKISSDFVRYLKGAEWGGADT